MTHPECGNCARPVHDGAGICTHCTATLATALRGVPELVDDLLVTLAKQDQLASGAGRGAEQALPLRLDIPDAIWTLGNTLTVWAREVAQVGGLRVDARHLARPIRGHAQAPLTKAETISGCARCPTSDLPTGMCAHCRGARPPRGLRPDEQVTVLHLPLAPVIAWSQPTALDSLRFAATWLADRIKYLRRLLDLAQAYDELSHAIDQATAACSAPPPRLFVGRCEEQECQADLYGWPDHRPICCRGCGREYRDMRDRWDSALYRLLGYPATAATIARFAGELYGVPINRGTINVWHHRSRKLGERGKLQPVDWVSAGVDAAGKLRPPVPRFRIGDVLDLARARRSQSRAS